MKSPGVEISCFAKHPPPAEEGEKSRTGGSRSERHAGHGMLVRDSIIGFADGLTVPFALTAGLSSLNNQKIVVLGGLAELLAGSISMGLGAYLAAVTERKHYEVEEARGRRDVARCPAAEEEVMYEIFDQYGVGRTSCTAVVNSLKADEGMWVKFMMDFELKLEKRSTKMAWTEGLVMGASYFFGGLLPMIPYFATRRVFDAAIASVAITSAILLAFGYTKSRLTGCSHRDSAIGALQTLFIGGAAAGVSYGIVNVMNSSKAFD